MIFLLSWRNIWRNKKRSVVITLAISFGIVAAILADAYMNGMVFQMVNTRIDEQLGHIQIHHPEFNNENNIKYLIEDEELVIKTIRQHPAVEAVSERLVINGMISSASASRGVMINGIDPQVEAKLSLIDSTIVDGSYFGGKGRNKILISPFMANKLGVRLRSKVILRFQDLNGDIVSGAFRVIGIYKMADARANSVQVFVRQTDLARLAHIDKSFHEIAIRVNNINQTDSVLADLKDQIQNNLAQSWGELAPELKMMSGYTTEWNMIFTGIIMLALLFGIMNTMLMSVLERVREFGTLIALGMQHAFIFTMIIIETIFLSLVGAITGMTAAYFLMNYLGKNGIDLSSYSEGLSTMGISHMIYPDSSEGIYLQVVIFVFSVALLSAIYPGIKAMRLQVTDAIRSL